MRKRKRKEREKTSQERNGKEGRESEVKTADDHKRRPHKGDLDMRKKEIEKERDNERGGRQKEKETEENKGYQLQRCPRRP